MVASLLSACEAAGQEADPPPNVPEPGVVRDSLPFRTGQWGAEFLINDGTAGVGVLYFRTPRRAWVLDASFPCDRRGSPSRRRRRDRERVRRAVGGHRPWLQLAAGRPRTSVLTPVSIYQLDKLIIHGVRLRIPGANRGRGAVLQVIAQELARDAAQRFVN